MKENETYLSFEETERLCRLYMECQLSILEEAELHYILGKLPYRSDTIDETRTLMDIASAYNLDNEKMDTRQTIQTVGKKAWPKVLACAASLAVIISLGMALWFNHNSHEEYYCQVFENGKEVNRKDALSYAESEMARIDNFIEQMIEIDSQLQERIDSFNHKQE